MSDAHASRDTTVYPEQLVGKVLEDAESILLALVPRIAHLTTVKDEVDQGKLICDLLLECYTTGAVAMLHVVLRSYRSAQAWYVGLPQHRCPQHVYHDEYDTCVNHVWELVSLDGDQVRLQCVFCACPAQVTPEQQTIVWPSV